MAHNNTSLHCNIPPKLIDTIIDFLHSDIQSLLACALVFRSWLPSSRLHLFRSCTIRDPAAFHIITTTPDVSLHILHLTIVGKRIHGFTFEMLAALLGHLPHLRRLSLHEFMFLDVPRLPQRREPFKLKELELLECDATMYNYIHLFCILELFSAVETLFIASTSSARIKYSACRLPDWALTPVHVAVQHLHTFDIPFPIIETLLNTLGAANSLQTFWYDDNVPIWVTSEMEKFGRMAASLPAHEQLRCVILGPLPIFRSALNMDQAFEAMQLGSMRGLHTFHLRGHLLETHTARVFAALSDSVREARFVVPGVSSAQREGFLNQFHKFAGAFADELARRREMVFVLDLGVARRKLSKEKFAALRMWAEAGLRSLRLVAPGRVRIDDALEGLEVTRVPVAGAPELFPEQWS